MSEAVKIDFSLFVSGIIAEGWMALGMIENPITKKKEKNVQHASYVIDTLDILKDKTKGNLTDQENYVLEQGVYQLRMMYVSELNKETPK